MGFFPPSWSIECYITFHFLWCLFHTCCFGFVDGSGRESIHGQAKREKGKKKKLKKNKKKGVCVCVNIWKEGI